jgi:hypothetical protein
MTKSTNQADEVICLANLLDIPYYVAAIQLGYLPDIPDATYREDVNSDEYRRYFSQWEELRSIISARLKA